MTVLTTIRERFAGRQADAETQYLKLVKDSAVGRDSDVSALSTLLSLTGRSMAEFIGDVEKVELRSVARLKLAEVERLKPAYEAASKASGEAADAVDAAREKARKLVDDALAVFSEKGSVSSVLSRQIRDLERQAHEDLLATADPALQDELDRLEAEVNQCEGEANDVRERQRSSLGFGEGNDPVELLARIDGEISDMRERMEDIRRLQLT